VSTKTRDKKATLAAIAAELNKTHGVGTVVLGSEISNYVLPRITTGSLALDVALGGGWPANQWNEVLGWESTGKTTIVLKSIAANQASDPDWVCVWVAAEHFNSEWARALGVDLDRVILVEDNLMEVGYEAAIRYAETREVDCIVIDSLPAMVPGDEAEKGIEEMTVSAAARLTNRFFRKVSKAMRRSMVEEDRPITGIIINQWRDQIGAFSPNPNVTPKTSPGGKGKNFSYYTRIEILRGDWLRYKGTRVGQEIKFRVVKNKSAAPMREAFVDFYFEPVEGFSVGDFDTVKEVASCALSLGVLEQPPGTQSGTYVFEERGYKQRGKENVSKDLSEDPALRTALEYAVRKRLAQKDAPVLSPEDEE